MVRHVILWQLKDGYSPAEQAAIKADIQTGLAGLVGVVPGLLSVSVHTEGLPSSSGADLMLDAAFTDEAALAAYAVHPAHQAVANGKVRPYIQRRACFDFTAE